ALVGLVGAAGAPVVQHDDLVAGSKCGHLAVPGGRRHAEAVDEHQRRAFAVDLVIQFDAADAGFGHGGSTSLSCRAVVTGRTRGAAHLIDAPDPDNDIRPSSHFRAGAKGTAAPRRTPSTP